MVDSWTRNPSRISTLKMRLRLKVTVIHLRSGCRDRYVKQIVCNKKDNFAPNVGDGACVTLSKETQLPLSDSPVPSLSPLHTYTWLLKRRLMNKFSGCSLIGQCVCVCVSVSDSVCPHLLINAISERVCSAASLIISDCQPCRRVKKRVSLCFYQPEQVCVSPTVTAAHTP